MEKTSNHQNISQEHTDFSSTVTKAFHTNRRGSIFGVLWNPSQPAELDVPDARILGIRRDPMTWEALVPMFLSTTGLCHTAQDQVQAQPRLPGKAQLRFHSPTSPTVQDTFFWPLIPPPPKTLLSNRWVGLFHRQENPSHAAYTANSLQLHCWTLPWHRR